MNQSQQLAGAIGAIVVVLVRLLKEDVRFLPNVPSAWRGPLVVLLSYAAGALQAIASGEHLSTAIPNGSGVLVSAVMLYATVRLVSPKAAGANGGLDALLREFAKQRDAEANSKSDAPKTPRSGTIPGGPVSVVLLIFTAAMVVLHQLACTPQQLAAVQSGAKLLGVVCDVAADASASTEVEYACEILDAAAPMATLIPLASASAKAGPPMAAPVRPKVRVIVPRDEVGAFEKANRVRRAPK